MVKAINLLLNKGIAVSADLVGDIVDKNYKCEIDKYIADHHMEEAVSFKGRTDNTELRKMLPLYDLYVSPSFMEMSPFNILEAKAVGLPIVACRTGGIPDIISNNVDGMLVPIQQINSLANAIEKLLKSKELREQLGNTAYNHISTINSPASAANRINKFFNSL